MTVNTNAIGGIPHEPIRSITEKEYATLALKARQWDEMWGDVNPEGGDPRYLRVLDDMRAMHIRKSADYGADEDPLANLRASADFGIPPWLGATLRLSDKLSRIQAFARNGKLANEGVRDSFLDAACYAILALVLYNETQ